MEGKRLDGTDYSGMPQYPDRKSELPPVRKTDFFWRSAEAFAATLIGTAALGLPSLVIGSVLAVILLLQGADLLGVLQGVATVTLIGLGAGFAFGLCIDLRRGIHSHIRGD